MVDPLVEALADRAIAIGKDACESAFSGFLEMDEEVATQFAALFWAVPATILGELAVARNVLEGDNLQAVFDEVTGEFAVWASLEAGWDLGDADLEDNKFTDAICAKILKFTGMLSELMTSQSKSFITLKVVCARDVALDAELRDNSRLFKAAMLCVGQTMEAVVSLQKTR